MRDGHLAYLYFSGPEIVDLSPLSDVTNLETLYLRRAGVADLAPLHDLEKLELVNLEGTSVSDAEIDRLRQALPGCEIQR